MDKVDIIATIACVLFVAVPALIGWFWAKKMYEIDMMDVGNYLTDTEKLNITVDLLKKIVRPYTPEDDINCLDDVLILTRETLDRIGEEW